MWDGYEIRDVTMKSLRRQMGVMTQDNFLLPEPSGIISATGSRMLPGRR